MVRRHDSQIPPIAALEDPVRRRIYEGVRRAGRAVTREEVADDVGISRKLAAFHLDKLLERGLLTSHYARPPGRSGRGAGRSAKYYRPSEIQIEISIPERHYDLAGSLLVDAIQSQEPNESAREAAFRVARERGRSIGEQQRQARKLRRAGAERALSVTGEILEEHGFEPYRDEPGGLALRNCPFHSLAQAAPDLVCEMNQAFIDGMLRGLGNDTVEAVLACKPGDCCVTLRSRSTARA
jgi:predicted ArsR family transcriptional regulator